MRDLRGIWVGAGIGLALTLPARAEEKPRAAPTPKAFGTCRESGYEAQPLWRKYHNLELLADEHGNITLRDRYDYPPVEEKLVKLPPVPGAPVEPGPLSAERTYSYKRGNTYWADDLPPNLMGLVNECFAIYESGNAGFFELSKLAPMAAGPVPMPAEPAPRLHYSLLVVDDHSHQKIPFVCEVDVVNPLHCGNESDPVSESRRASNRRTKKLREAAPLVKGGSGEQTGKNAEAAR